MPYCLAIVANTTEIKKSVVQTLSARFPNSNSFIRVCTIKVQ